MSLDGEVIGDAPLRFVGGVLGRPLTWVGELGEAGRRKGDERGELKEEDLYEAYTITEDGLILRSNKPKAQTKREGSCGVVEPTILTRWWRWHQQQLD